MDSKKMRLRRLFGLESNKTLLCPIDHGVTLGPIKGLSDVGETLKNLSLDKVNAVILHKGNFKNYKNILFSSDTSFILHLSASVSLNNDSGLFKTLIADVEEAIRIGADGVSIHVNIGNKYDHNMLRDFGKISRKCDQWNMPLLAMIYPRGEGIEEYSEKNIALAVRVGMELGADIIKVSYTGSPESFSRVISGITTPVVMAGGEHKDNAENFFQQARDALDAGARGLAIGRNIFQYQNSKLMINILNKLVHEKISVKKALSLVKNI